MGAAIGGVGGVLRAVASPSIDADQFVFQVSITIVVMIVLGGIGSVPGVILGAIALEYFDQKLLANLSDAVKTNGLVTDPGSPLHFLANAPIQNSRFLIYGLVLLAFVLLRPQGIIPNKRRQRELQQATSAEEATVVGAFAIEQAGGSLPGGDESEQTQYTGPGSDAQGREG
jgi:branched-chain amino acid transport system permease protein